MEPANRCRTGCWKRANATDRILNLVDPARRDTLIAQSEGAVLRFDIRLQGESETVFFAL